MTFVEKFAFPRCCPDGLSLRHCVKRPVELNLADQEVALSEVHKGFTRISLRCPSGGALIVVIRGDWTTTVFGLCCVALADDLCDVQPGALNSHEFHGSLILGFMMLLETRAHVAYSPYW